MNLLLASLIALLPVEPTSALDRRIAERGAAMIDRLVEEHEVPGVSVALVLGDDATGRPLTFAAGFADREAERRMTPADRLLSGSIGKTYVTAAAHHLMLAGELDFDAKAIEWFEGEAWFERLPNAKEFTVRQLLRHQTGIPRHVFVPEFLPDCASDPDRVWQPRELLSYVFDADPLFPAGEAWAYADTNYIIVGMILEKQTGTPFYDYVREHLLDPHQLDDTVPTDSRRIEGLAQGVIASPAFEGMPARTLEDGVFFLNPQFEWCGGGYASTALDLARWAHVLYRGEGLPGTDGTYLASMLDAVPVRPGLPIEYGLGVFVRPTEHGPLHGHDGFMLGYQATMGYLPDARVAFALMMNTDDGRILGKPLHLVALDLVKIIEEERAAPR